MSEVFISYRHGPADSWPASAIAAHLAQHFPVFIDTTRDSLDLGDEFPPAIDKALNECRVLFAVIGSDWTNAANLRRLADDHDWVRRELRTALNRSTIRVVPLLIQPTTWPTVDSLPVDLRPLVDRQALSMSPGRLETDAGDLVKRLERWLSGRARDAVTAVPAGIPFLCDRKDQEESLVEVARLADPGAGLLACVVHGHKWESHDELLARFESEGVLEDIFGRPQEGIAVHPLQLNRGKLRIGGFADALKSAIKADVLGRRTISDGDLQAALKNLAEPLVIIVQYTWSDYVDIGDSLIRELVKAWDGLVPVEGHRPADRVVATSDARRNGAVRALLWINLTYEDDERELSGEMLVRPLPKLQSVGEGHIREWLLLRKVAPYVVAKRSDLLAIPNRSKYAGPAGRLHMMQFAEEVTRILSTR